MELDKTTYLGVALITEVTKLEKLFELLVQKGIITEEERQKLKSDSATDVTKMFETVFKENKS